MISAWWLIPAMMAGALVGIMMLATCSASRRDDDK